ncbi:MAG: hypothetical protein HC887_06145 [Desulfobacteraceae bacterium]|nr:hypothetical protein [Desulfobacteraceae bacterium]
MTGRSYAAIEDVRKIAKERKFEVIECHTIAGATPEATAKMLECVQTLAPKIDAYYLTIQASVNKETLPKILPIMNARKVPVFSQAGSDEAKQGALLSISSSANVKSYGKCHAETIARIINGAKPRELDQVCEAPAKIAFNAATAMIIGLKPEVYNMLSQTAEELYQEIETVK